MAQFSKQFQPVHARHFNVEHANIGRLVFERGKCRVAVCIAAHAETIRLQRDTHRSQNIGIIIDQDYLSH